MLEYFLHVCFELGRTLPLLLIQEVEVGFMFTMTKVVAVQCSGAAKETGLLTGELRMSEVPLQAGPSASLSLTSCPPSFGRHVELPSRCWAALPLGSSSAGSEIRTLDLPGLFFLTSTCSQLSTGSRAQC